MRGKDLLTFIKDDELRGEMESSLKELKEDQVYEFSCTMLSKTGAETVFNWVAIAKNGRIHASARMNAC
ncbi:MAG: hypothetical protein JKY52_00570 [Flavobacteriales bacterium]|nr:hypothetical protein [Flavobacteriales bacterium]